MTSYDILSALIERDNRRMYETVGQPVPNTVTVINGAEKAIGFEPVNKSSETPHAEQAGPELVSQS